MSPARMKIRTVFRSGYKKARYNIPSRIEICVWENVALGIKPLMNSIVDSVDVNFLLIKVKDD